MHGVGRLLLFKNQLPSVKSVIECMPFAAIQLTFLKEKKMKPHRILSIALLLLLAPPATFAQTKTVKGNYCGQLTGNRGGTFGFKVGSKVMTFQMNFGQIRGNARMVRFNVNKLKVGDQFIIKYTTDGQDTDWIVAITGTGRRKKIEPCIIE